MQTDFKQTLEQKGFIGGPEILKMGNPFTWIKGGGSSDFQFFLDMPMVLLSFKEVDLG